MKVAISECAPPWSLSLEEDRRFYRILGLCLLSSSLLGIVVPYVPLPVAKLSTADALPPRKVRLLDPTPMPQPSVAPAIAASSKVEPTAKPQPVHSSQPARPSIAEQGVLAMQAALAELQNRRPVIGSRIDRVEPAVNAAPQQASLLAEGLTNVGGTIEVGVHHESVLGSTDLPERFESPLVLPEEGESGGAVASAVDAGMRTEQEIQEVLDRHKGAMYALYIRALRRDPDLQGKLLLRITILPSGAVTLCETLDSSLDAASLDRELTALVRGIDFGERVGAPAVTTRIPIEFFPQ